MILSGEMTQQASKNNTYVRTISEIKREPYLFINIFLAGVILLIIAYSGIFSPVKDNYPVICVHEKLTGEHCASCGLSHSLSLILRGKADEAYQWNIYGMRVFLFFISQLVLRFAFSIYYLQKPEHGRSLVILDSIGSGMLFLLAFWPYIKWLIKNMI